MDAFLSRVRGIADGPVERLPESSYELVRRQVLERVPADGRAEVFAMLGIEES